MNKFAFKLGAGVLAGTLLAASVAPSAFAATINVSGNGNHSDNKVKVKKTNKQSVAQTSKTKANTTVNNKAKTGGNKANGNTGSGAVTINTGHATNTTTVSVTGGSNTAVLPDPCECVEDHDIDIVDNGSNSDNKVVVKSKNVVEVSQTTKTKATTDVDNVANTGNNKANNNTGDGDVDLDTGDADNTTDVVVDGGSNALNP